MADSGIKKVTVLRKDLPALNTKYGEYLVRYRIVSEDKNRTSHWSQVYSLLAEDVETITPVTVVDTDANTITVTWESPDGYISNIFDLYTNIDSAGWQHLATISSNSYTFSANEGEELFIAVQVETFTKDRLDKATLFLTTQQF